MRRKSRNQRTFGVSSSTPGSPIAVVRRGSFDDLPPVVLEIEGDKVEFVDYPTIGRAYAEAAASGAIDVCRYVRLAAQRYLNMLELAASPDGPFTFSKEHVIDYCSFVEKLEHIEDGNWVFTQIDEFGDPDPRIILEPWQIWVECAIHGFRWRGTGERVVRRSIEVVPRKNAKTLKTSAAGLYDLTCSGQASPQVVITASTRDQADRVYEPMVKFISKSEDMAEHFQLVANKKYIRCHLNDGQVWRLSSYGEKNDGLNPSLAILEELHAQDESNYKVLRSAFGARPNALMRMITTAGYKPVGICWDIVQDAIRILEGKDEDYTTFAVIYTLDRDDYLDDAGNVRYDALFSDERLWYKANPMMGVSLDVDKIRSDAREASRQPEQRGEFLRTRFNIWTNAGMALVDHEALGKCRDDTLTMEEFLGERCWMGLDLASKSDMCAMAMLFERDDMVYGFFRYWLPQESNTVSDTDLYQQVLSWTEGGWLTLTPGGRADFSVIEDEIRAYCTVFDIQSVAYDPYQSNELARRLWESGVNVIEYGNHEKNMSAPTDDLLTRIHDGHGFRYDGNPVFTWNALNVYGQRRGNGRILPKKESDSSKMKIDGFVAAVMANGVRIDPDRRPRTATQPPKPSPYLSRGLLGSREAAL